jgi:hypothetical protein
MKISAILLLCFGLFVKSFAQPTLQEAFIKLPIGDDINYQNDSQVIVRVQLPDASPITIEKNTIGALLPNYKNSPNNTDSIIGAGRCSLIDGDYYFFKLNLKNGERPQKDDLLFVKVKLTIAFIGQLYPIAKQSITLLSVTDSVICNSYQPFGFATANQENEIIQSLVKDIIYTGKVMAVEMPQTNLPVKTGFYKNKKLFDVMQQCTNKDLQEFLRYIEARPSKYAGNAWKISEIFATWVDAGAPSVVSK